MNKFRKERYIYQNQSKLTGKWSFRVKYKNIDESFHEADYLSASAAFKEAVKLRNKVVTAPFVEARVQEMPTVKRLFDLLPSFYSLQPETHRKLTCAFNLYVSHKDVPVNLIKIEDVQNDLNNMSVNCSNDLISRVRSIWIKIFNIAIVKGYCKTNLAELVTTPKSRKIKPNKRDEKTDEQTIERLSNYLSNHLESPHERYYAPIILKVLFFTGMRPSEMFALEKTDIDLAKQTIRINKRVNSSRQSQMITNTKTDESNRTIPYNQKLHEIFTELLNKDSEILFPTPDERYYLPANLSDRYHQHAKKIGINFHMYQCRHTFITNLYLKGIDIKTIQDLVGQKIDATTLGYVISSEERMKKAIEQF